MSQINIPADLRERVIAAAADLYQQSGRARFPTVDAVRRASRADMNAVSAVMKEWRQAQTAQAAPVAVGVPEALQQANATATATLWQQATELANQSLRSAQAAWEVERQEFDDMRAELASSYETQASELDAVKQQLANSLAKVAAQAHELAALHQREAAASTRANTAEARSVEIERRAADLRTELDQAHAATERQRIEFDRARMAAAAALDVANTATQAVRVELGQTVAQVQHMAERLTQAQGERDAAAQATMQARELAAGLAGQLEATQTHNAALMAFSHRSETV